MSKLVQTLMQKGHLTDEAVTSALAAVPRTEFIPSKFFSINNSDIPIPLGSGQMLPAPSVIVQMLELLQAKKGDSVLVVGFGGGWVSTLLSHIVGKEGHVSSCDKSQIAKTTAHENTQKFSFIQEGDGINFFTIDSCQQLEQSEKFDRIIVINPDFGMCNLQKHLNTKGRLVTPRKNFVYMYDEESSEGNESETTFLPS